MPEVSAERIEAARQHVECFRRRKRDFEEDQAGFEHALSLIRAAADDLGVDWACDLFFAAERDYWTGRNRAGINEIIRDTDPRRTESARR